MPDRHPPRTAGRPAGPPRAGRRPSGPAPGARRAVGATLVTAAVLTAAFLAAPPLGSDLSAQVARAGFFERHGFAPLDLGWYGGVAPPGYSLVSPPLMAWLGGGTLGPRLVGALAAAGSALVLALILVRTAARRPLLGGVLGAVCLFGNLVSGRVTYAVGIAFGLLAILALTSRRRRAGPVAAVLAALLAGAASPVAGLFVGLAGVALALTDPRRRLAGAAVAAGAAVPVLGLAALFGSGGWMNISFLDTARAAVASLAVALLVPHRAVRAGALLSAGGVVTAYLVHTPVGLNATRLAVMFTLPLLAGYAVVPGAARLRRPLAAGALGPLLVAVALVQPPVSTADLRAAGDPTASPAYFRPLLDELDRRPPGRVEVVPTGNYWEAAYVPPHAPLARGWLRQADIAHHPLFFDGSVDTDSYGRWLRDNGVAYVALAGAPTSWVGRREAEVVRAGPPYLTPVWRGGDWTLYAVAATPSIVDGAVLVDADDRAVEIDVPAAGDALVRVRWSRWLTVDGPAGCLTPSGDGWTLLRAAEPGRYRITGAWRTGPTCPPPP
ncbi:hypothetical protein AB0M79_08585 [Polymorphospora sp. NPDC051019]|uniref:hypothetical protein n=1 Tax=Polymorphospora sp. NPDC051019 TaxID=3155725 RepID=UPI00341F4559